MTLLYWHAVSEVIKSDSGATKIIINYSIIYSSKIWPISFEHRQ